MDMFLIYYHISITQIDPVLRLKISLKQNTIIYHYKYNRINKQLN